MAAPVPARGRGLDPLSASFLTALWAALLLPAVPVVAQSDGESAQIRAVRVEAGPEIDGRLDDPVWARAAVIDGFVQQEPVEGFPATERTEVRLLYDEARIYFGVHAFDSEPERIVATEMRRNADRVLQEDNVQIILDTFRDSRSAYMFVVTPLGARLEQQVFNEGEGGRGGVSANVNRDWDGVWEVATRRTSDGWTAEIAIPLSTLRFPGADVQSWGLNIMRNIARKNEQVFWAPIPRGYGLTRVSLAGEITDLQALQGGRDLRVKPFAVGGGRWADEGPGRARSTQGDVGVDLRYGITASLSLDVTINTDFAQAEVDDEQVNLTRFPLFFPEKREFFLENAGQFNVGTLSSSDRMADLFFSRRIGLSEAGEEIPILAGARLTGRVGRNSIAALTVQTDEAFGNPGENFLVTRYSRDLGERSRVGGLFINKMVREGGHWNRTAAADLSLAPHPSFIVDGFLAGTATAGPAGNGMGGHLRAAWLDDRWNVYAEYTDLDDDFNAEVGFVPRTGIRTGKFHLERTPRPGRFGIRVLEPMYNITYTTDQEGRLLSRRHHYMLGSRWDDGSRFIVWYNDYFERLDRPFAVRPDVVVDPGTYRFGEWRFWYMSNRAARVYGSLTYSPQRFFDGRRTDISSSLGVRLTPRLATEAGLSRNEVDLPAGSFRAAVGSLRLDYAISPDMNVRTLTQYNSLTEQWSSNARFRYTYRPGSDLYVVYDNIRREGIQELREHQLLVKATFLMGW